MGGRVRNTKVAANRRPSSTIIEVILENFMSHEYSRISIEKGLNIICGPNGSGKSAILIAISVALGQAYTERSRKLSDLIRRGKDTARVSLLFDNKSVSGRRPFPISKSDTLMLSRYLKSDGSYWYEADYREISKNEVVQLFKESGLNPDNMLIIMHQGMVEEFAVTSSQEKLKMVEEAVGFQEYRENIFEAESKLSGIVSEEGILNQTLDNAGQTLDYWKNIYDKYQIKKGLFEKKEYLSRELVWSQVLKYRINIENIENRIKKKMQILDDVVQLISRNELLAERAKNNFFSHRVELRKLYFNLIELENEKVGNNVMTETYSKESKAFEKVLLLVEESKRALNNESLKSIRKYICKLIKEIESRKNEILPRDRYIPNKITNIKANLEKTERKIDKSVELYVSNMVKEAILQYRRKGLGRDINELKFSIIENQKLLSSLSEERKKSGPAIDTERSPNEVSEDIKVTLAHLQSLEDVPEDAENLYNNYSSTYEELKSKLSTVSENKSHISKELAYRKKIWKEALDNLIVNINPIYTNILSKINALGFVSLSDTNEIDNTGLELTVGFRGSSPVLLDAFTQSGGERSVAIMAFLLSLQEQVLSPFRAVDEFDVHMDPRNRETMFQMIFSRRREMVNSQYIVITPSQISVTDPDVQIITVQNSYGKSEPKKVIK